MTGHDLIEKLNVASPWELLCMRALESARLENGHVTRLFVPFPPYRTRWPQRLAQRLLRAAYEKHDRPLASARFL